MMMIMITVHILPPKVCKSSLNLWRQLGLLSAADDADDDEGHQRRTAVTTASTTTENRRSRVFGDCRQDDLSATQSVCWSTPLLVPVNNQYMITQSKSSSPDRQRKNLDSKTDST